MNLNRKRLKKDVQNQVHRKGDSNVVGGSITTVNQSSVYVNNKLASVDGSRGTSHIPFTQIHLVDQWVTANGNPTVRINSIPVNRQGHSDSCGHARAAGSPNVRVG